MRRRPEKIEVVRSLSHDARIMSESSHDVVPPRTRESVLKSTFRNLKTGGLYVLVIPRNDQSIARRCTDDNRYADGHVFYHRGVTTFYKNFRSHEYLATKLRRMGYRLLEDMSIYRHVCLILEKLPGGQRGRGKSVAAALCTEGVEAGLSQWRIDGLSSRQTTVAAAAM